MSEPTIKSDLPVAVVEAFASSAVTTLWELTQLEAIPTESPQATTCLEDGGIVMAVVRLLRTVPGNMTLVISADIARRLAERYLPNGTELSEEIVDDVAGEFANVIAGQAKTILKGTPYHFLLSLPVVSRHRNAERQPGVAILLTFESGQIQLYLELPRVDED